MNNVEIIELMKAHPATRRVLGGVYARDTLPMEPKTERPIGYIVNTDDSWKTGEHWICIYFPPGTDVHPEYFDSFAQPTVKTEFEKFMQGTYKRNIISLQNPFSTTCGQYCMFYIYMRFVCGISMEDIITLALDRMDNDSYVNSFIEQVFGENLDVFDVSFFRKKWSEKKMLF